MAKKFGDYKINEELEAGAQIQDEGDASTLTVYSSSKVSELLGTKVSSATITAIESVTQAEYDLLTPIETTLYIIVG